MSKSIEKIIWPWVLISLYFFVVVTAYMFNFYEYKWSKNPGDWGLIGDYFGGLLNPLISTITLLFLIKAYVSQKEELRDTRQALESTETHSRKSAESQEKLTEIQIRQSLINERIMNIQYLSCKIEQKYKKISFLQKELERCTEAKVNDRNSVDLEGNNLVGDASFEKYRLNLISQISITNKDIEEINVQVEKFQN